MRKLLDKILLSDNVVEEFNQYYQNEDFNSWLNSILPEIEACKNANQDNPWHIYSCLGHILRTVQAINGQTKQLPNNVRRQLAYTMLMHDIGKPECKIRRYSKLYGREVDSFPNHNLASARVAKASLAKFGFNNNEIAEMLKLIEHHDVFIPITVDTSIEKHKKMVTLDDMYNIISKLDINNNGQQMMQYLLLIGRADNLGQNPEMTVTPLKLIDVMEQMLEDIKTQTKSKA